MTDVGRIERSTENPDAQGFLDEDRHNPTV